MLSRPKFEINNINNFLSNLDLKKPTLFFKKIAKKSIKKR